MKNKNVILQHDGPMVSFQLKDGSTDWHIITTLQNVPKINKGTELLFHYNNEGNFVKITDLKGKIVCSDVYPETKSYENCV